MADPLYSEKEAQEILNLATKRVTADGGMTRERLIQAAEEMGISASEILAAEQEVKGRQQQAELRERFFADKRKKFLSSFSSLVGTSISLYGISYLTMGWHGIFGTWAIWPCGFMALAAAGEAWEFLSAKTGIDDAAFEKWIAKQERKGRLERSEVMQPNVGMHFKIAREAYAEYGADDIDNAVREVHKKTRLRRREARRLLEQVSQEHLWTSPATTPTSPDLRSNLSTAKPMHAGSLFEIAGQALEQVGPSRTAEAIEIVRTRTGLSTKECQEAVEAVIELHQ